MKTSIKTGLSAVVAAAMFATSFVAVPAIAMPLPKAGVSQSTDVEQVQYYRERHYRDRDRRAWREDRRGWHNGHRGYREQRRGYRRHSDGWWYPLAAFGAGAVIGGAISNSRPSASGVNPRHYQWCSARYRTYRAYDNTYVPRVGVRATCQSPYY